VLRQTLYPRRHVRRELTWCLILFPNPLKALEVVRPTSILSVLEVTTSSVPKPKTPVGALTRLELTEVMDGFIEHVDKRFQRVDDRFQNVDDQLTRIRDHFETVATKDEVSNIRHDVSDIMKQLDRIELHVTGLSGRVEALEDVVKMIKSKLTIK
jgi:hypothetical protein